MHYRRSLLRRNRRDAVEDALIAPEMLKQARQRPKMLPDEKHLRRSESALANYETIQSERRASARRMLEGYRAFCDMHDSMLRLMEDCDSRLLSTTAQMGETVASSAAGDAIGSGLAKLETASDRLQSVDDRICAKLDEALRIVERVIEINPTAGRVLSLRYLVPAGDEPTFEEIADEMGYSADHVRHMHLLGLDIAHIVAKDSTKQHMNS